MQLARLANVSAMLTMPGSTSVFAVNSSQNRLRSLHKTGTSGLPGKPKLAFHGMIACGTGQQAANNKGKQPLGKLETMVCRIVCWAIGKYTPTQAKGYIRFSTNTTCMEHAHGRAVITWHLCHFGQSCAALAILTRYDHAAHAAIVGWNKGDKLSLCRPGALVAHLM